MKLHRCLLPLLVFAAGCGRAGLVPVTGVVQLDGRPVENASVLFNSDAGVSAYGVTDAKGGFTLTTRTPGDGVAPGRYHVGVSKCVQEGGPAVDANGLEDSRSVGYAKPAASKHVIPEFFNNPETSTIVVTVAAGGPPVMLALASAPE